MLLAANRWLVMHAMVGGSASITQLNTVRKHLSAIKGGQLAAAAHPARVIALVLSDVVGDPLDVIASGPTVADTSSFVDALATIEALGVTSLPPRVLKRLQVRSCVSCVCCSKTPQAAVQGMGIVAVPRAFNQTLRCFLFS